MMFFIFAFICKGIFFTSQIVDNRASKKDDSIADERLVMVCQSKDGEFYITSPAKFIDLHTPTDRMETKSEIIMKLKSDVLRKVPYFGTLRKISILLW